MFPAKSRSGGPMHSIPQIWLPVVVAAVAVFVASSLIHMVFKWHVSEYRPLANEDEVRAALRAGNAAPGSYVIPHCADMKKMRDEAMLQKFREGPVAFLTVVRSGTPHMGKALGAWFVLNLFIAWFAGVTAAAYVGPHGNGHYAGHLVGIITLLAYG